ncbi:MAG: hypothetical protein KVP17_000143 [Porospora cf. gigantea B]|uniref:uncharacterized protein n=1 Tax=Porospora cf. gigantea B TaxID=2853592 RepID=UPI003571C644|nr:MAG: hypothetical protein KVP17_000143 [Porospora cf. gigantea B]
MKESHLETSPATCGNASVVDRTTLIMAVSSVNPPVIPSVNPIMVGNGHQRTQDVLFVIATSTD